MATKWLRILSIPPNNKIRNHLVAKPINTPRVIEYACTVGRWQNLKIQHFIYILIVYTVLLFELNSCNGKFIAISSNENEVVRFPWNGRNFHATNLMNIDGHWARSGTTAYFGLAPSVKREKNRTILSCAMCDRLDQTIVELCFRWNVRLCFLIAMFPLTVSYVSIWKSRSDVDLWWWQIFIFIRGKFKGAKICEISNIGCLLFVISNFNLENDNASSRSLTICRSASYNKK